MKVALPTHIILLWSLASWSVSSFNIDTQYPYVIKNEFNAPDAHFGVSVLLLPAMNLNPDDNKSAGPEGWVFIGCPKGNSTHSKLSNINQPGVIWRCGIGQSKPTVNACVIVHIDPTGDYSETVSDWAHEDMKEGAWIGGTMAAVGDRFVACGSRWVNQKYTKNNNMVQSMNGICYWVPKNNVLTNAGNEINEKWPVLPQKFSYRLQAFLKKEKQFIGDTGYFNWMMAQQGFSLHIAKNGREMIIGAPGVFNSTGTVVQYRDAFSATTQIHQRFNNHPGSSVFAEVLVAQVRGDIDKHYEHFQDGDYFGYAVTSGHFLNTNLSKLRVQYASGSPKAASLYGKVLVFCFKDTISPQLSYLEKLTKPIQLPEQYKIGGFASYFGSVILSLNVDGSQFDELLIGAPQFSIYKHKDFNSNSKNYDNPLGKIIGDQGCVFIFRSNGSNFDDHPEHLCGNMIAGARFGSAITSLGDINSDGYMDFAVGAPFENDDHGAVYVYHGGINVKLSQILHPEPIDPHIRTFGYSLSSADVDNNGYSDLAVGAYASNTVVIYRTIPVVKFDATLSTELPMLLRTTREISIRSCISYTGNGTVPESLLVTVRLDILNPTNNTKLLTWVAHKSQLSKNVSDLLLTLEQTFSFRKTGSCNTFTAVKIGKLKEVPSPVVITKTFWVQNTSASTIVKPIQYTINVDGRGKPITNYESNHSTETFNEKLPMSMNNLVSYATLEIPVASVCDSEKDPLPYCTADLKIKAFFMDSNGNAVSETQPLKLNSSDLLVMNLELWNYLELANLPITLDIHWFAPLKVRTSSHSCEKLNQKPENHILRCYGQRSLRENEMQTFEIEFYLYELYAGEFGNSILFFINATTKSNPIGAPTTLLYVLPLKFQMHYEDFRYDDETALAAGSESDIFKFSQAVEIGLIGPTPIYASRLEMYIPKHFEWKGQFLELAQFRRPAITYNGELYLCSTFNDSFVDEPPKSYKQINQTFGELFSNEVLDDWKLNHMISLSQVVDDLPHSNVRRYKRDADDAMEESVVSYDFLRIACDEPKFHCSKIICDLKYFLQSSKAVIEFRIRLKPSIIEKILDSNSNRKIKFITFESKGQLLMMNKSGSPFGTTADVVLVTKIELSERIEVPLWVLIVAIFIGISLLIIMTAALVQCGFFRRKQKELLESLQPTTSAKF